MRKFEYVNRVISTGFETKEPDFKLPERNQLDMILNA